MGAEEHTRWCVYSNAATTVLGLKESDGIAGPEE